MSLFVGNAALPWCIVGFSAGICLFYWGFHLLRRRRLIQNVPRSKIRSASLGMVEISGITVGPQTMAAPITGQPCYYYSTTVYEWKKDGDDKSWEEIASECRQLPFFLDDNTGKVLVQTGGSELDIPCDFQQEFCDLFFSPKSRSPESVRNLLARHGVATRNTIKVVEYCIKPNTPLFILGTLAENSRATSSQPSEAGQPEGFDSRLVMTRGAHNKTFLISTQSEADLVGSLGWQSTLMIWGGPILALLSLYALLTAAGLI